MAVRIPEAVLDAEGDPCGGDGHESGVAVEPPGVQRRQGHGGHRLMTGYGARGARPVRNGKGQGVTPPPKDVATLGQVWVERAEKVLENIFLEQKIRYLGNVGLLILCVVRCVYQKYIWVTHY